MSRLLGDENLGHRLGTEWQGGHSDEYFEPDGVATECVADVVDHGSTVDSVDAVARAFSKMHRIETLAKLGCGEGHHVNPRCVLQQSPGRHGAIPERRLRWI